MKYDFGLEEDTFNVYKLGPHEAIINIFVKTLFTDIGSDFFDRTKGTGLLKANSEERIRIEVTSAVTQTKKIVNTDITRFDKPILLLDVKILGISFAPGVVNIYLNFIFSDKQNVETTIEVPST